MTTGVITFTDAPSMVAAAICELARRGSERTGELPPHHRLRTAILERHRTRCGWCEYPRQLLANSISAAYRWSELHREYVLESDALDWQVRQLVGLPPREQLRRCIEAQAMEDVPVATEPMAPSPSPTADVAPVATEPAVSTDAAEPDWWDDLPREGAA